jgi:diguanylate cyclase (GGDEF)-like protein
VKPTAHNLSPQAKTIAASALLATIAAGLTLRTVVGQPLGSLVQQPLLFAALTVTFFLAEQFLVNIEFRRQSHSMTFAGVPLAVGLMLLPMNELLLARLVGSLAALLIQRISAEKTIYNTSAYVFEVAATASVVHLWFGTPIELKLVPIAILLGCVAVGDQLMSVLVLWVIKIHGGTLTRHDVAEVLLPSLLLSVVATVFATAVSMLIHEGPVGDFLVVLLVAFAIMIYRSYASTTRRHQALELVHDFVALSVGAQSLEELGHQSLSRIRHILRATTAELILTSRSETRDGGAARSQAAMFRLVVNEDDSIHTGEHTPDPADWVRSKALHHGEPTLATRGSKDRATQKWLDGRHANDAIVAPLIVGTETLGIITVLDRLSDTATFTPDDLTLLQTLTSHLAVSLRSTRLLERLSYDATHDSLTGLANRARLNARISDAAAEGSAQLAVLLLDLDKFKEVNDVLGHDVGDRLLIVIGDRLRACLPATATIARLGGDEFAVLLVGLGANPESAAMGLAQRACAELGKPIRFDEALLAPQASVGVAVLTDAKPADLLRCADTAMYAAKFAHGAVSQYHPDMDRGRAERLALVSDLRVALDNHPEQFILHYQPKFDLRRGSVVSAEALVRWNHPKFGIITPDRFIPLAETSGLIDRLTTHVLAEALAECAEWTRQGHALSVAVNLSARNVCDAALPDRVSRLLADAGVSPDLLILEITESSVMEEPDRAVPVLHRLADLGICLSLDDFGTGYSSLSYLQRLPVSELKIDRSFVAGLTEPRAEHSRALIRSNQSSVGGNGPELGWFRQFQTAPKDSPLYENGLQLRSKTAIMDDIRSGKLPQVSWVQPEASEHPSGLPAAGAQYMYDLLDALASTPEVWNKTALFITYDENGGFFDHVTPPSPPPGTPGEYLTGTLPSAAGGVAGPIGLGFRVPTFVISPWSQGGWVNSEVFDHTSRPVSACSSRTSARGGGRRSVTSPRRCACRAGTCRSPSCPTPRPCWRRSSRKSPPCHPRPYPPPSPCPTRNPAPAPGSNLSSAILASRPARHTPVAQTRQGPPDLSVRGIPASGPSRQHRDHRTRR